MSTLHKAVQESARTTVHFVGFAGLPAQRQRNDFVRSEKFTCLGHEWELRLCPGGDFYADEGMVSVYLIKMSENSINVEITSRVKDRVDIEEETRIFEPIEGSPQCWGEPNFAQRSNIMDSLVDGALIIEVLMKLADPTEIPPPFIPENPSACKIIQDMFMDEESADIVFEVGGQTSDKNSKKKAKTSSVTFPAHRLIMRKYSSTLAELCGSAGDGDKTAPIQIPDVSPDVFRHMLFHLYGGKVADDDMKSHAKEIVDVADRYGIVDLKLAAETCLVRATTFSVENLLDILLYADSKNCALLKEAAMDFMLENKVEILEKISFNDAPGAFVSDVLAALTRGEKKGGLSAMRVNELRWKAHKSGLNVDGSREMLVAALKESS